MTYATQNDLSDILGADRLLDIADRDRDDVPDGPVIARALEDAASEIDAAIGKRYKLPVSPVPALLRRIACDIAHYHLDLNPSEDTMNRAAAARKTLMRISRGDDVLFGVDPADSGVKESDQGGASDNLAQVGSHKSSLDLGGF